MPDKECGVTVIVVENGIGDPSSNLGRSSLCFTFMLMPFGKCCDADKRKTRGTQKVR